MLLQRVGGGPRKVEAVSKYFVLQAVARVILMFGILVRWETSENLMLWGSYSAFSHSLILFGLMIKLAVFPNPFWFVDVVSGLSLSRGLYVVVISKLAPLYLFFSLSEPKQLAIFLVIGLFSVFIGRALGTNQNGVRKIVALSSIAKLGWFIVCLPFLGGYLGSLCFFGYVVTIVPVLWLGSYYSYYYLLKGGQIYHSPTSSFLFISGLLSLGGLPPFIGFFIKWQLFQGLVNVGLFWVCSVLIARSLLSLYFYLKVCFSVWSIKWADSRSSVLFDQVYRVGPAFFISCSVLLILVVRVGCFFIGPIGS